ncbi:MAG: hypothetical protein H6842_14830 [Rhodospirillaceae bacterium]|nr:hypothetical protein [Rhodospirillaceae bacterium]
MAQSLSLGNRTPRLYTSIHHDEAQSNIDDHIKILRIDKETPESALLGRGYSQKFKNFILERAFPGDDLPARVDNVSEI